MYKGLLLFLLTWTDLQAVSAFPYNYGYDGPRHRHHHGSQKRDAVHCPFPYAEKMVAVTPKEGNAGWAISPNQYCTSGSWCPYACEPGYVMGQWSPQATSYSYPESMHGGLYCDHDGNAVKPFGDRDYCYPGVGNVFAIDKTGEGVSFCQTVLPGNEAMLIPTWISADSEQVLAVPDASYWVSTAAHYYINPPGVSTNEGCIWGTSEKPYGNWAPYVAGANMDENNITYVKLGANPIYLDDPYWSTIKPSFGLKLECEGDTCSGLPCYIDPREKGVQGCPDGSPNGAGNACFCVVGFQPGTKARIVVVDYSDQKTSSSSVSSYISSPTSTPVIASSTSINSSAFSSSFSPTSGFSTSIQTISNQSNTQASTSYVSSMPTPHINVTQTLPSDFSSSIPSSDTQTINQSLSSMTTAHTSTTDSGKDGYHKASGEISSEKTVSPTSFANVNAANQLMTNQGSQSNTSEEKFRPNSSIITATNSFGIDQSDISNSGWSTPTNVPMDPATTKNSPKHGPSKSSKSEEKTVSGITTSPTSASANIFLTTVTSYLNSASPVVHTFDGQETTTTTSVSVQNMHAKIQTAVPTLVVSEMVHETTTQYV
ncbi:beta-glucosidase Adg3 [Schizosaccharomyces octosporus yFS286]|uniref:Beta-glucosidase Adg3 n=1 Tax=Schizosaccharomyces octosporus (strain yFS286) TaxID=483514 RepID=S9RHY3_SCHOY|nr:beta-glucosidase Adg3 [Schizosaccharomyces octosporus yFS286]EPX73594.1 beta-glucosidase Adg3 [Schizosaccharomyces octosporus yFS286]